MVPRLPRFRVRKRPRSDAAEAKPAAVASPTAYRTFSPKIAPGLTGVGGAAVALGGLGQWIRATIVPAEGLAAEEIMVTAGFEDPIGRLLVGLGAVALVASALWFGTGLLFRLVPAATALVTVGVIVWRMPWFGEQISQLTADARSGPQLDFVAFHAGLGWGAWLLIGGALLLFLGVVVGLLRELDLRRGFGG
jgi:hypothetical protein